MAQGPRHPQIPSLASHQHPAGREKPRPRQGGMQPQRILCSPACALRGSIPLHKPEWKLAPQKYQTWLGPEPTSREDPHRLFLSLPPPTGVGLKNYEIMKLCLVSQGQDVPLYAQILDKMSYRVSHSPSPGLRAGKSSPSCEFCEGAEIYGAVLSTLRVRLGWKSGWGGKSCP